MQNDDRPTVALALQKLFGPDPLSGLGANQIRTLWHIHQHIDVISDAYRDHWIWAGPVLPRSGVPMVHRWASHKNVPVHRILWAVLRRQPLKGYPRRLQECPHTLCVNPDCFTLSTPMEPQSMPEYMIRSGRTDGAGEPIKDYKVMPAGDGYFQFSDRYIWKPDQWSFIETFCPHCTERVTLPCCPNKHVIQAAWAARPWDVSNVGKQYRCEGCARLKAIALKLRGSRPRSRFRPASATNNSKEQEVKEYMASHPFGEPLNTPEQAREEARLGRMSFDEQVDAAMQDLRASDDDVDVERSYFEEAAAEHSRELDAAFQKDLRDAREHPELFDAETLEYLLSIEPDD